MEAIERYGLFALPGSERFHSRTLQVAHQYIGDFVFIFNNKDQRIFVHFISAGEIPLSSLLDIFSTIRHSLREKVPWSRKFPG